MSEELNIDLQPTINELKAAVSALNALGTSAEANFKAMKLSSSDAAGTFDSNSKVLIHAFGVVKSQLNILSDAMTRLSVQEKTESNVRLAMRSQESKTLQNIYETQYTGLAALNTRFSAEELLKHKASRVNLLQVDKDYLDKRKVESEQLSTWLAARDQKTLDDERIRREYQASSLYAGKLGTNLVKQQAAEELAVKQAASALLISEAEARAKKELAVNAWWQKALHDQDVKAAALKVSEAEARARKELAVNAWWQKALYDQDVKAAADSTALAKATQATKLDLLNAQIRKANTDYNSVVATGNAIPSSIAAQRRVDTIFDKAVPVVALPTIITPASEAAQSVSLSKLGASLKSFAVNSNDAHSAARGLAAGFGGLFLTWGAMVPLLAGSAVSYSFAAIVRSGAEVQNTLTQIGVLAGATNTELQGLSGQLLSMAKSGPFGPKEIAEAMKTLSLAGLDATKVALALPEVLNFSVAGTTSLKTAADTLTTVGTAFSISAANYGYISDVISKAAAESKSSIEGMSEAFKTASVISQQYGVSLEDTAISLALLANAGISGTAAGTAMRNMFVDLSGRTPKVRAALTELKVDALDAFGKMRGQAEIFKDVMVALSEYKPKAQSRLIQEIFSERGAKDAIAIMTALKQQATDTAGTVTTVYDDLAKKMQESAGFSAIAAAQMALTPLNEMKSVGATLEAVFVETFTSIQPYITDFATSLKATFNSTEFKSGIKDLAVSFATVTKFLIDHAGTIGDLVLGYFAFKGAVTLLGGAFVLLETYSLAAASGLTATAIAAKLLTNSTPILAVLSGVVAIGAAAWGLYATNSSKASTATDTYVGSSATQLLAKLDDEYDRLVKINTARITGITLQEAEAKAALENARNSKPEGVEKLEKELASVKARKDAVRDPRSIGPKLTDSANLEVKLQSQIDKLYSEQGEKLLLIEQRTAGIVAIRQQAAEAAKAETLAARNSIVSGNKDFNPVDKAAAAALAKQVREEAAAADKRIAADIKEYDDRFKEAKSSYDSQQQILDNAHKNKLLSEGAYQAEQVIGMVEYNSTVEKLSKESNDKVFGGIVARGEQIEKQLATGKITTEEADNAYSALDITWTNFARKLADADTSRAEAEIKRLAISAQNAEGKIVALRESVTTFWKQDAIDAAASVGKISYAVDEFTIAMEGAANTANAKYEKELIRLTKVQEDAVTAVDDYKAKMQERGGVIALIDDSELQGLQKLLDAADKLVKEHSQKAADGVATAMSTALESAVRQAQKRVVTSIADAIMLGITDGAESGVKAFRKILEQELVTKPFRIMLEAALTGNGGTGGGILGSTISTITQSAASLGSTVANIAYGGQSIMGAAKWFGSQGFGDSFVNAINQVGGKLFNMGAEKIGSSLIETSQINGLSNTISSLGDGLSYLSSVVSASEGKWGAAVGSALGTYFGGPIGGFIGNFIGSIVDKGFGGGGEYTTGSGIQGTLANSGSNAQTWQSWYNPGSWWGQSSNGRNVSSIDQKAVDSLTKVFISTKASVIGFGEALGKNTSGVLNYSRSFSFDTGGSAAANKSAIEGLLKTIADEMAAQLITTKYQKEGERLGDTLARLATNLTSVNAVMFLLDKTALSLSETGAGAASELVDLFGSLDAFTTASKNYYDLFFTAEEKHADTTAVLAKSFAKLNLAMPLTNAGFRALVEAQDISTEAGRSTYVSLMELSTAFASLTGGAGAASAAINVLTGLTEGDFATRVAYERVKGRLLNGESTTGLSGIPGFASGGSFDGGWRVVGENGPELEHTGPSSIYNNSQSLFDTTQLVAELQALRLEVSNLRAETRAIVSNTTKSVKLGDKWDTEGMPAVRA